MIGFALAFFAAALPNAVVLQPVANMYSKPTEDADVVSQAIYASNVAILEMKDGWAHIRTFDDYTGWAPLTALKQAAPYAAAGHVAEVQSLAAHIYRENSVTKHAPLLTVPFETKLEVASEHGNWIEVRLPDGRPGWIQAGDVVFDGKPISTADMLALSKKFLGRPYTWGGTSSFGYDCSGFMQMLERRRGVMMPRDAQPQADWSGVEPVEKTNLEPGDLLYFGSSPKHITHTGMYLGEGKFIDATTHVTPMVRIDDLNEPFWTRLLVAQRRVK
ncbi:MAG TPA: NlpC/P60 family protein [Candidatus Limnocylindrales bacterium]|nr:NlpC/P60 family protein [Candidatus Limnocylindrales bacterium]